MQNDRPYTKQQLINSMKVVYRLLEYELKNNDFSRKYLNDLANSKFPEYGYLFNKQDIDDMGAGEDYIGKKNIYDHVVLKAIDDYRYNNDILILYRNFLLLLHFMRSMYLYDIKKRTDTLRIKSTIFILSEYDTPLKLFKAIFLITKNGKTYYNQNVDKEFVDTITNMFEELAGEINFSFIDALDRTATGLVDDTAKRKNTTQLIKGLFKILCQHLAVPKIVS